jgi:BirA family biotin operon repressor/biotin-[acetyl-CoA-carboxylase] ligase
MADRAPNRFGPIERFAVIDSTNRWLLDAARTGAATGTVAVADEQTAGRGRLGRAWVAPPGGSLLASVLLRPTLPLDAWHLYTVSAALAAADALHRSTGGCLVTRVKWPNDLVVDGAKLAGVLAEAAGDALVVGIGVNLDWPAVPEELTGIATAVSLTGAPVPTRDRLLDIWLRYWRGWLEILEAPAGRDRVRAAAEHASATLGTTVRVEIPGGTFTGTAVAITAAGHLVIDTGGERRTVTAGDVVHLR